jgi:hypothetical protein
VSKHTPGERVFAVESATESEVRLFGRGVYDGEFNPPFASDVPQFTNPRITLDDGRVVWGMECWWGAESRLEAFVAGRNVIEVKEPTDAR